MKHISILIVVILFAACVTSNATAADCVVTSAADSGAGTLREMLKPKNNCTNVSFDTEAMGSNVIKLNSTLYLETSYIVLGSDAIDFGAVPVQLENGAALNNSSPLLYVTGHYNIIGWFVLSHPGGTCLKIKGFNNEVKFNSFISCKTGVQVNIGDNDLIFSNGFEGIGESEITLTSGGNLNIGTASKLDAIMKTPDLWVLMGEVPDTADMVQVYEFGIKADGTEYKYFKGATKEIIDMEQLYGIVGAPSLFMAPFLSQEGKYSPLKPFAVIVSDAKGSTSAFSDAVIPMQLPSFFDDYPACADAEWFIDDGEGYWVGDFDGDGIENRYEDANTDCLIDGQEETDPAFADTDGDGYCDGIVATLSCIGGDNCPLIPNADQIDNDSDGVGNVCGLDADGDGINNVLDNCPLVSNPEQIDKDGNGLGDACDKDTDGAGLGDILDNDADGDSVADAIDNCPFIANPDQTDSDNNGIGAACDAAENVSTLPSETPPPDFLEGEEEPVDENEASGDSGGCSLIR